MGSAFSQYLAERFPVGPYLILIGAMVAAATGAACLAAPGPVTFGWEQAAVLVILMAGFFHLRVFDEHKDYGKDVIAHPDRVLSRGLVTLAQLRRAGAIAIVVQLALGALLGWQALGWVVAYIAFSVLMRYEFFVPRWLNEHIVVYAITHNPIVALMMMVAVVAALGATAFPPAVIWWLLVATFTSLGFEVGRKLRAPGDEREGQDTYSKALGPGRAAALLGVLCLLGAAAAFPLLAAVWTRVALAGVALLMVAAPVAYAREPTAKAAKGAENASTLGALLIYILVIADAAAREGIAWT